MLSGSWGFLREWSCPLAFPSVRTISIIDAVFRQKQSFYGNAFGYVALDYLFNIFQPNSPIPDSFWVNDYTWAMLALIKASTTVSSSCRPEPLYLQSRLKGTSQSLTTFRITAPSRVTRGSLVTAYKNMVFEIRHLVA